MRGFYRGLGPSLGQIVPSMSLVFYLHEAIMDGLQGIQVPAKDFIAGGSAGLMSKILMHPIDVIRKRLQVQGPDKQHLFQSIPRYSSFWRCAVTTLRLEGPLALYKGLAPSLLKAAPNTAITFQVFHLCKTYRKLYDFISAYLASMW